MTMMKMDDGDDLSALTSKAVVSTKLPRRLQMTASLVVVSADDNLLVDASFVTDSEELPAREVLD